MEQQACTTQVQAPSGLGFDEATEIEGRFVESRAGGVCLSACGPGCQRFPVCASFYSNNEVIPMYQKILLAVDDSHASELALSQAIILARSTGSEVKALFVVSSETGGLIRKEGTSTEPEISATGQRALADAAKLLQAAGIIHLTKLSESHVLPEQIHEVIVAEADAWNADLVVMGTHGRRGVNRMVLGSVSEGVISKTAKPVLLVRSALED